VEEALIAEAYNDHPLPIGHKQTISQPYIVALMTEALELTGKRRPLNWYRERISDRNPGGTVRKGIHHREDQAAYGTGEVAF